MSPMNCTIDNSTVPYIHYSFHRQGRRSQSLQVRSSYDLELYSTKYQVTTIHWLFQTQSQNSPLFPPRLAMFPTLLYASASDSSSLEFVRYINSVIIIIIIIIEQGLTVKKILSGPLGPRAPLYDRVSRDGSYSPTSVTDKRQTDNILWL